jgi:hypothetical protein
MEAQSAQLDSGAVGIGMEKVGKWKKLSPGCGGDTYYCHTSPPPDTGGLVAKLRGAL